jgi:selenocysteine lyase/cysteine desulfurase
MTLSQFPLFIEKFPEYAATESFDRLRETEYSRLDRQGQTYLDFTGAGLYAESQVLRHQRLLLDGVFGNPHSSNPTSSAATELIEEARKSVLCFFNASEEDYVVIFTSNASGALKLVCEA